jgi:hypothetical protein
VRAMTPKNRRLPRISKARLEEMIEQATVGVGAVPLHSQVTLIWKWHEAGELDYLVRIASIA